jgi:glycosyltransferase involved in cell wall biosynthesis
MNLFFFIRSLNQGGAERQLVNLARSLYLKGHDITICYYYSGGLFEKELKGSGVKMVCLNKKSRWDIFPFFISLALLLGKKRPEVFYSFLDTSNVLSIFMKPLMPNIPVVWGVRSSNMDLSMYDWLRRFSYFLERKLSRFADLIIANSHAGMENAILNGFPKEKITVIPNGIDTRVFYPQEKLRKNIRDEWCIQDHETLIGLVARLDPKKDHLNFIKAAYRVARMHENVRFVCVGRGENVHYERLRRLEKEHGLKDKIIWAGQRKDMTAVYNALDMLCLSSMFGEGFPNVIGEAMACGVPCVATNVGDSSRIIGDTGIVVPPGDSKILADGIMKLLTRLDTDKDDLKVRARERIVELFEAEKMMLRTETLLMDRIK